MQLSMCIKWRHVRHEITFKNDQRIIVVHVRDSHVSAFERDRIFIVQNFAVQGDVVKLSTPFRRAGVKM